MLQILTILQILVAVGLIGLILLQQGKGADAGAAFGSGGAGSIFGARGSASFLSRATAVLAAVFFFNSIGLAYISGESVDRESVTERFGVSVDAPTSSEPVPAPGTFVTDLPDLPAEGSESLNKGADLPDMPDSGEGQKTQ
jgi:preprotein translocase subunit SecG